MEVIGATRHDAGAATERGPRVLAGGGRSVLGEGAGEPERGLSR